MLTIKRHTKVPRYYLSLLMMSFLAPKLHKRVMYRMRNLNRMPRPFTVFLKKYFSDKYVVGAEVGVYHGKNARNMFDELAVDLMYLVDLWPDEAMIQKTVDNLGDHVKQCVFRRGLSVEKSKTVIDGTLDFCYIDASHVYQDVYDDIEAWYPKVKTGGVIGGHDMLNNISVTQAVIDWCVIHGVPVTIAFPDWIVMKQ